MAPDPTRIIYTLCYIRVVRRDAIPKNHVCIPPSPIFERTSFRPSFERARRSGELGPPQVSSVALSQLEPVVPASAALAPVLMRRWLLLESNRLQCASKFDRLITDSLYYVGSNSRPAL